MRHLYKDIFKSAIKVGDIVCIQKEGDVPDELIQGEVTKILSCDNGVKVRINTSTDKAKNIELEGFIVYVIRDGNIEYGSL